MTVTTYNNVVMPSLMYGTAWKKEATAKLVQQAVEAGFTAIDTANQLIHYNEALVGEALLALAKKGIARESLFIQTKFTPVDGQGGKQPYDAKATITAQVKQSMDSSLSHLHTEQVDSYVLHGPYSRHDLSAADWEVWAAIEELYAQGKTRVIGISNVNANQLAELCVGAKTKPMIVQNRCYAVSGWDKNVRDICKQYGIIYQGFSLLTANPQVLSDPAVQAIAQRLKTGAEQVIFKFSMMVGMQPLTGTTNTQHMKDDLKAEQLDLTAEDVKLIEGISMSSRSAW